MFITVEQAKILTLVITLRKGSEGKESTYKQETQVRSLGRADPLEHGMATHSTCLKNAMDRGGWWATAHGLTKSRARLSKSHTHKTSGV